LWARTTPADPRPLYVPLGKHLAVQLGSRVDLIAPDVDGEGIADAPTINVVEHEFLGFRWVKLVPFVTWWDGFDVTPPPTTPRGSLLAVPFWFVVLSSGLLPMITAGRILRVRRRVFMGQCSVCGYDLRASKIRCPECGTAMPSNAEATA